jgi:beta-glucosidase
MIDRQNGTTTSTHSLSRRDVLRGLSALGAAGAIPGVARAEALSRLASSPAPGKAFPDKFLWGAATAAHQVEGNNVNSDLWTLEHLQNSMFKEPSGDACDHYHLYEQDIARLAGLGFNTYRFSIEWARIEPDEGFFSMAELEHYRRMLQTCHEHRLTPLVTFYHYSLPRWLALSGGWENPRAPELYARYCEKATRHLGDLIGYASTMNEPNLPQLLQWMPLPNGQTVSEMMQESLPGIRTQTNAPKFANFFVGDAMKRRDAFLTAHAKAKDAMKSALPSMPVGFNLALTDDQPAAHDSHLEQKRAECYAPWLEVARSCDYLGVQTYSRTLVGVRDLPPAPGVELTQNGMEFYPECLEHTVRYAAKEAKVPILVTENGVATEDDTRRVVYYSRAVAGLKRAMDDGVDVRGYVTWSLLDNFEWVFGFTPKLGIVAVDLKTQQRTTKPSGVFLGNIARKNSL